jgi:hypothetical protein
MPRKLLLLLLAGVAMGCGGGGEAAPSAEDSAADAALAATAAANAARRNAGPAGANSTALVLDTAALAGDAPLMRETFGYDVASRDPFRAVLSFESSGPELPDLRLVGILYDEGSPSNSVATFRDIGSSKRYNVRPGDRIGRLLVASVQSKDVVLRMNDFGTVREQTYSLRKTEDEAP